jgi:DNA-directed RNA polymerase specialized sigma subunit
MAKLQKQAMTSYRRRLLERYLPLVRQQVDAFRQKGVEKEDLVQEGVIGLLSAIKGV